ncbi:uncharacterized protein G2W53_025507 [Senna tora]|uniref:Uncharacterized protein n=1 Tax=Senna tora TaxID=362788 RepID=A0A834TF93_9FABA|nr:uncharacterized protein G2W53_025507 [Senna tora]
MDLLWENFNEELLCSTSRTTTSTTTSREEEEVELRKVGPQEALFSHQFSSQPQKESIVEVLMGVIDASFG